MTRRKRNPMSPLKDGDHVYECVNKDFWPPVEVSAYKEELIDPVLREHPDLPVAEAFRGVLPDVTYQRIKTWEQVCGLHEMSSQRCISCPHVIKDGHRVTDIGTGRSNTIHDKRSLKAKR